MRLSRFLLTVAAMFVCMPLAVMPMSVEAADIPEPIPIMQTTIVIEPDELVIVPAIVEVDAPKPFAPSNLDQAGIDVGAFDPIDPGRA